MEPDTEIHSQTLGQATGTPKKRRGHNYRNQISWSWTPGVPRPQSQISRVYSGSQRLKQWTLTLFGSVLGPLFICYVCVTWWSWGTSNCGSRLSLTLLSDLGTLPPTGSPFRLDVCALSYGNCFIVLCWYPWVVCSFLKGNWGAKVLRKRESGREIGECREGKLLEIFCGRKDVFSFCRPG